MANNTYVELDTVTLGSNTGPITFSNIPQTYTDLRIVFKGGFVDSGFTIGARVGNGTVDTGTNYSYQLFRGSYAGSANSTRKSGMVFGAFCQQGGNNLNNVITVDFFNYSNTTTFKTWSSRYSNSLEGADACVSLWRSTAAINTISIAECGDGGSGSFNYGNMLSGTSVSLYGIRAEAVSPTPKATGGSIYGDSTYYYHVFGATGTFIPNTSLTADILTFAGGGGGGGANAGGGGGAGGYVLSSSQSLASATSYTCTVGAGGSGGSGVGSRGTSGTNSNVTGGSLSLTASVGGGGGGASNTGGGQSNGLSGGSGGGAGNDTGTGGSPTSGQGFKGGDDSNTSLPGGGGGAGGAGANSTSSNLAAAGGVGISTFNSWSATTGVGQFIDGSYYIGGGGAGGLNTQSAYQFASVRSYGGGGINGTSASSVNGLPNMGAGGAGFSYAGGAGTYLSGSGGSGVIIIRYLKA